ncbi:MAG: helix-turn-helix transcriptional regulator [Saprospiraceae bacterium]|nr:helix-turn-helix transcriptional regulator [Saprospiraceae bacterium]
MKSTKVVFSSEKLNYSCELMRALAHPLRLKILEQIDTHGEIHVNNIYNQLQIEQSITSQHLKVLRLAGVVNQEKNGKFMNYTINYDILEKAELAVNRFLKK